MKITGYEYDWPSFWLLPTFLFLIILMLTFLAKHWLFRMSSFFPYSEPDARTLSTPWVHRGGCVGGIAYLPSKNMKPFFIVHSFWENLLSLLHTANWFPKSSKVANFLTAWKIKSFSKSDSIPAEKCFPSCGSSWNFMEGSWDFFF